MKQDYDVVQLSAAMGTNINLMLIKLNELNRMGWQLNLPYVTHSEDVYKRQVELRSIKNRTRSSVVHIGIYQIQVGTDVYKRQVLEPGPNR